MMTSRAEYRLCLLYTSFLTHGLGYSRILLQEISQLLADNIVHCRTGLAVAQLLFCLALKLGILDFNTDNGCQALAYILTGPVSYTHLDVYKRQGRRTKRLLSSLIYSKGRDRAQDILEYPVPKSSR